MTLSTLCIRRPVMTTLLTISLVIFGLFGYQLMPIAALPPIEYPTLVVSAQLPGASPETMASAVATPLEKQFSTIAGIESISSANTLGSTQITLQFILDRALDAAAMDVQSAIGVAQRRLPVEMTAPPSFRKVNPADSPVMTLALTSPVLPLSEVNEAAENVIARRLSTIQGVAQVLVYGQQRYAVRIGVDPNLLYQRNLTMSELHQALATANSNTPTGTLFGADRQFTIQSTGQMAQAEEYKPLIVAWRNGQPVRLQDVAKVEDSVENNKLATWFNGVRAIVFAVQRQPDANTVAVTDAIHQLIPQFRAQLPPAIELNVLIDRSRSVRESLYDIQLTMAITLGLVLLVIFLFLRSITATIIPAVVLPVSLIGSCAVMYLLHFSIDTMSLMALTLAVGFVVDDAIVMLENIVRHIERGESVMNAALQGAREISFTIISITLSLIAAFIPILFMGGVVGRIFNEFAITISLAIFISGIAALTVTPLLCSRLLRPLSTKPPALIYRWLGTMFDAMQNGYLRSLDFVLRHHVITFILTIITLVGSIVMFYMVPKGFFPSEDIGIIYGTTAAAEDIAFSAMVERQQALVEIVRNDPDVQTINSTVGAGGPNAAMNNGRLFIILKPLGVRKAGSVEVIQRLRRQAAVVPGISFYMQPMQNFSLTSRSSKSTYQYTLQGSNIAELFTWADRLEAQLKEVPGLQDVTSDLQIKTPMAMVAIDREKAASLKVNVESLRSALFDSFGSRQSATIYAPNDAYAVIMEIAPEYQQNPDDLTGLYVRSLSGELVPLASFAKVEQIAGASRINHLDQLPATTFSFNLAKGVFLGEAVERIHELERNIRLPATLFTRFEGTAQIFEKSFQNQVILILAAIFVVYVVLGVLYESYVHPVTILSGLPSAAIGALLTLMWLGQDLNVMAMIGLIMLIGIVKKNAIMMIDFAIDHQRGGVGVLPAIRQACYLRFRPIMMTTMAALMGALPIAFGMGAGGELRRPLGITVVGGLLLSQFLTLYITPVIYIYLERARDKIFGHASVA